VIEYGILQFQAQDLGDEFKLSRGLFLGGFAALGYLYPQLVDAHLWTTMVTQSMKEMTMTWELVIMVTKTSVAEEFFFITAALEFWKIDRLVARKGDGCLVVAPKTIQRQANLHRKGMYNNKTKFKSSHILVLRNCSKFSLKNQSIN